MNEKQYIKCPSCGEEILATLLRCIYCHSILKKKNNEESTSLKYETTDLYGGTYIGELLNDKPNGQGTLTLPNGSTYSGFWKEGKPNGKGKLKKSDGRKYEGDFLNGKRHGLGKFSYPDGRQFEGEWGNGKFIRLIAKSNYFEADINENQSQNSKSFADRDSKVVLETNVIEQQNQNKGIDTNIDRPTEVIIVSIALFLYSLWHLYTIILWGGIISLFFAGIGIYAGIGLLLKSRIAYILSFILAGLVMLLMGLDLVATMLNFGRTPPYYNFEVNLSWFVVSLFILYCLGTYRTKNYFKSVK